jgi:hypothetical protein
MRLHLAHRMPRVEPENLVAEMASRMRGAGATLSPTPPGHQAGACHRA